MSGARVSFSAQVDAWVRESQERMNAVFRQSVQDVVEEMQKVGPSVASTRAAIAKGVGTTGKGKNKKQKFGPVPAAGEGGHMPVDTGFLRASLRITTGAPVPMTEEGSGATSYDEGAVLLAIAGASPGATLFASYSANYARRVNYGFVGTDSAGREYNQRGYYFVQLAAQKWPQIVAANVGALRAMSSSAGSGK